MQSRSLFFLFILLLCGSCSLYAQKVDTSFHIYLLMGQSNMAGRGPITEEYAKMEHARVFMLDKEGKWTKAKHPLHFDKPKAAGVGPGLSFGIKMAEANNKVKIGLVPCAVGGTSINSWVPGGLDAATKTHPYDDAVERIKTAMKSGVIKGVIWLQGESDASKSQDYLQKLTELVARVRNEVGNDQLPFVASELGRYRKVYDAVSTEIRKLPAYVANTSVVTTEGLEHKGDTTHFNSPSATILGERFAAAMLGLLSNVSTPSKVNTGQRIVQSINSNWQFHKGDIDGYPKQNDTTIAWEEVSLPHSWNTTDVTDDERGYYRGTGWYKKTLYIPSSWKDKDVFVFFEGANQVADVFVNGQAVGRHIGGYNYFNFPLNKYLKYADDGVAANEIVVKVDNRNNNDIPPLSADFTFFGGIYRDVYLIAARPVHFDMANVASNGVFITTPTVNADKATLTAKGALTNTTSSSKELLITTNVVDADGKVVASKQSNIKARAGETIAFEHSIDNIIKPKLWSPEDPYLYKVISTIQDKKTKVEEDVVVNPLGFRWFEFDAQKGFFLNGKRYKLIGTNRHQDYKEMANALPDAMHVRDVELLKAMGGNFLRVAHYPQDPAILQACDRLGILASVEIPIVNEITESEAFSNNCKQMQLEMIRQSYNHPSVIIWTYMNEVLLRPHYDNNTPQRETYLKNVAQLAQQLEDLTRKEDPYRYTMIPCHGSFDLYNNAGLTTIPRIVGWNLYQGWYSGQLEDFAKYLDKHHAVLPNKPVIVTEFGADADPRLHSLQPVRFDKSNEYAVNYHKVYWKAIAERPFVAGGTIWNLADFNSEQRAEAMPHFNNKGIMTIEREPKESYLFYQAHLLQKPFVAIGSKRWKLRSGEAEASSKLYCTQPVEVYTNQPSITLKLNGKVIGTERPSFGTATFNVPFVNGTNQLEAIATGSNEVKDFATIDFQLIPADLKSNDLPFTTLNVSLGDKRIFVDDKLHEVWLPEKQYEKGSWGYVGGEVYVMKGNTRQSYGSDKNILGTDYDPIYETQRVGIQAFKLDVPDGSYEVTLHFAELQSGQKSVELAYNLGSNSAGKETYNTRTFSVAVNGVAELEHVSNNNYLLPETAYSTKMSVIAKDGAGITMNFLPEKGFTILNGVQVKKIL